MKGSRLGRTFDALLGRMADTPERGAGHYRKSLDIYARILSGQPSYVHSAEIKYGRALCLEQLGEAAPAQAAYRELLANHPESQHAPLARTRVAQSHWRKAQSLSRRADAVDASDDAGLGSKQQLADAARAARAVVRGNGWVRERARRGRRLL